MADPGKLSPTKITTYKGCSMAYFLKYVEHVKVPASVRLVFGKEIHYLLDLFYQRKFKSAETFGKFWNWRWFSNISGDFLRGREKENLRVKEIAVNPNKSDFKIKIGNHVDIGPEPVGVFFGYMKLGRKILSSFYNKHKDRQKPFETEKSFGVRKDEQMLLNGILINGVFDRIDKTDKEWFITDYKTDKHSPEQDSFVLHRNIQFTLYSWAFRQIYRTKESAILYYHLRSLERLPTHRSERDYDYLKRTLDEVVEGISNDKFTPFYGFHCGMCDYKIACEKYSISSHGGPRIDLQGRIKPARNFDDFDIDSSKLDENLADLVISDDER